MQEIRKITANEDKKYPFLTELFTETKNFKFRFENLTEFRDYLYIFLHVKTKMEDLPLFVPNEYVIQVLTSVQPDSRAIAKHTRENRRSTEEDK